MSVTVYLFRAPDMERETHVVADLPAFLRATFPRGFPVGGRITDMATGAVVTPKSEADEPALRQYPGPFVIEVFAGGPETYIGIALAVVSAMIQTALAPDVPNATARNVRQESPNNGLSERTNRARVNGRVPDILGTVRSTCDMLAPPYKVFEDHVEKEIAYMCVGRGAYTIPAAEIRDDTTPCQEIAGTSIEIYGPFTSPNSGDAPQLRIGNAIGLPVLAAKRINSINGQVLQPPDAGRVVRRPARFESPNVIISQDTEVDYTEYFIPGDVIQVSESAQTDGTYSYATGDGGAMFETDTPSTAPERGVITFAGNFSGFWQAGHIMTITNGTVSWQYYDGGDGPILQGSGNLNGIYPVLSSSYDVTLDSTTVTLDISLNNSAWGNFNRQVRQSDVTGAPIISRPSDTIQFDLSGAYTINTVVGDRITLDNPAAVNPGWTTMADDYGGQSVTMFPVIATTAERWVGWVTVQSERPIRRLIANMVALNGLYSDNGQQQYRRNVDYRLEAQRVDENGNPFGAVHAFQRQVIGSATSRTTRASTLDVELVNTPHNRWRVRARRLSATDTEFEGQTVDEVKWRDLYACGYVEQAHFGDVTTVQAVTLATDGALAVKERKLNMLVTRNLPRRISGSTFTTELYPTNSVADILSAICLDPLIGNRKPDEIDFDNIYQTEQEIKDYFGIDVAQFNYTIDKDNLSFEEILTMIAGAVYCRAYRRGSVIRLFFERETDDSTLLFNHRNKLPGSEQRTEGSDREHDGIEYQWIDPANDAPTTIYIPADRSAVNPRRIESVGERIYEQAYIHAWREYGKLMYQDCSTQFDGLPEANLLIPSERFLCADNARGLSQDGEFIEVDEDNPRLVRLSQPMQWEVGQSYLIFIQNNDGQVERMSVSPGGSSRLALLERPPRTPIQTRGTDAYFPTTYLIGVGTTPRQPRAFILVEKDRANSDGTVPIRAINYDYRYYERDLDFHP